MFIQLIFKLFKNFKFTKNIHTMMQLKFLFLRKKEESHSNDSSLLLGQLFGLVTIQVHHNQVALIKIENYRKFLMYFFTVLLPA